MKKSIFLATLFAIALGTATEAMPVFHLKTSSKDTARKKRKMKPMRDTSNRDTSHKM